MNKVMQAVSITIFFIICMAGCGKEEQGGEIIQERERTEYDLAGNSWKEFDEVAESRESWGIANYWEDSELGAGSRNGGLGISKFCRRNGLLYSAGIYDGGGKL